MNVEIPISLEETAGIKRIAEPISFGVPFPCGGLLRLQKLKLHDPVDGLLPLQTEILARWPDGSAKWVLIDTKVNLAPCEKKTLAMSLSEANVPEADSDVTVDCRQKDGGWIINTGPAVFHLSPRCFKPFESIIFGSRNILDGRNAGFLLEDAQGHPYTPAIHSALLETQGPIRSTLLFQGSFDRQGNEGFVQWRSRLSFFSGSGLVRLEFSLHNNHSAKHPGGLWDMGNPGAIYFKDLSILLPIARDEGLLEAKLSVYEDPVPMAYVNIRENYAGTFKEYSFPEKQNSPMNIRLYQDSSGGANWKSRNHVNRINQVKESFRGYKIFENGESQKEGNRANPVISINNSGSGISLCVKHFWQNSPKSLEIADNVCRVRLFPGHFADLFELQGGEIKSHTVHLNAFGGDKAAAGLAWTHTPLLPLVSPAWIEQTETLEYFAPGEPNGGNRSLDDIIATAIQGENTFFHRREIIDEYGWRNFGDLYADHEAVGHDGPDPLVSHYNNQYDCLNSMLLQFLRTGDARWFILADQLCSHLRDIDIYHTDDDRLEYSHGLFWHTEHFLDASTASHRCFSRAHLSGKNQAAYGGGPSLAHVYSKGILLHFYLTGEKASQEALLELALFVENNLAMEATQFNKLIRLVRKLKSLCTLSRKPQGLVQINKVYGLDGPSRASGNALQTLIDAYSLTYENKYLDSAASLIHGCIGPDDNLAKRELLDIENRWFYTIFLQSLIRFLNCMEGCRIFGPAYDYARESLMRYVRWMAENEVLYLSKSESLDYPNESWPAQDLRKAMIFLSAARRANDSERDLLISRASYFIAQSLEQFFSFPSRNLTRPLAIVMQNCLPIFWFQQKKPESLIQQGRKASDANAVARLQIAPRKFRLSLKNEWSYVKWHILTKILD
jgi:hypothetical protein